MRIKFPSGPLTLEGVYDAGGTDAGVAVLCHPHPLYGGDMDNGVVLALAAGFRRGGYATLRFNFRGTGGSEGGYDGGVGEMADVQAAVAEARRRSGPSTVALGGYSFGAAMVVQAAPSLPEVDRLVVVAPPLSFGELKPLLKTALPQLVIAGDRDPYCPIGALAGAPGTIRILVGADHFLAGREQEISDVVATFLECGA